MVPYVPALCQRTYAFLRPFTLMEPPPTRAKHALDEVMNIMNSTFSEAYLSLAQRPRIVKQARHMFEELRGVFHDWLEENKLKMTPSTQTKALQKLRAMHFVPGSKPRWSHDPTSSEVPFGDNALDNLHLYAAWLYAVEWNKGDRPVEDKDIWSPSRDDHVYVVNAFYQSKANTIVLPTGILQPPYVLEEGEGQGQGQGVEQTTLRKRIYNVAYLGTLIGHEMFHAFDLDGFQLDAHGQYREAWYKAEKEWYHLRRPALLATYKSIAKRQHYNVDKWNDDTLSENLADLYGLFLTEDLLERKLDEWKVTGEAARKAAFRQFFEDYATQWRSTLRVGNMNRVLYHNEHILPQMRVNVTLSLSKRFREVYGIQPGEGMYYKKDASEFEDEV
jgi:putative endopeptidase